MVKEKQIQSDRWTEREKRRRDTNLFVVMLFLYRNVSGCILNS